MNDPSLSAMTAVPDSKFDRLKAILRTMFQLDRGDLDFGLYRIMNRKAGEITHFLDTELLPQVRAALAGNSAGQQAALNKELEQARQQARGLGVDPDTTPAVRELQRRYANARADANAEAEVYNHLTNFFSRYYDEGDFMSLRRYSGGGRPTYLIPYNGEEVKLHWANADQYYVKSTENYAAYVFTLATDAQTRRVRFEITRADTERDNVKETAGRQRRFVLAEDPGSVVVDKGELVVRFEHRPLTATEKKAYPPGGKQQDRINEAARDRILKALPPDWLRPLASPAPSERTKRVISSGGGRHVSSLSQPDRTVLDKHLAVYTAKNSFDYFIHKDLGGFLRRELDLYLKTEVLDLDDLAMGDTAQLNRALARLRAVRQVADKIIAFLAQIEDFQKHLWLKKKFVLDTHYCVTLDRVPETLYPEIAANEAQHDEWLRLFAIDRIAAAPTTPGYTNPLTVEFLKANPFLVLDTRHFDRDLSDRLLAALSDAGPLDEQLDGLLVHGENFQALHLLQTCYQGQVQCVYIDPPYNTDSEDFIYKDGYRYSSWSTMISDRLAAILPFMTQGSAIFVSIDENEQPNLRQHMNAIFGESNFVADMVWAAGRKNDSRLISVSHEYIVCYSRDKQRLSSNKIEWKQRKKGLDDIYSFYKKLKRQHGSDYATMTKALKNWFRALPAGHPAKAHIHYSHVDSRGIYFPADISWPGGGGPKYEVLHPETGKPVAVPSRGWMTADPMKMRQWIANNSVHFGADEKSVPCIKSYLKDHEYQAPYSVFYQDGCAATKRLRHILGQENFGYPKDEEIIAELVQMITSSNDSAIDFFAGSGTTGHAVINLNREDNGRRKYILVEVGHHFDTVLLPRMKKVVYAPDWKDGKPLSRTGVTQFFKYIRLESYEDTLDSLELTPRSDAQEDLLTANPALAEDYLLRYTLGEETAASACLLGTHFTDPFAYTLSVVRDGARRQTPVDLPQTFNYLLGLRVSAWRRLDGLLTITGTDASGQRCLILWRNLNDTDNAGLSDWFTRHRPAFAEPFDLLYVNGDHTLNALRQPHDTWTAQTIEPVFRELMFANARKM